MPKHWSVCRRRYSLNQVCWCDDGVVGAMIEKRFWLGGLVAEETMYGWLSYLLYLWDLEEKSGKKERGFTRKGWQATEVMRVEITHDCCLSLCLKNPWHITIQGKYKSIRSQKYFLVRALLVCFSNRHHYFSGYSTTFWKGGWKGDQIFKYSRFLFTVMKNKLLEPSFFISER